MKRFLLIAMLFILASITTEICSQTPFIKNNGIFAYFIGKSEPPADWKKIGFDDSGWIYGDTAIIGCGWPRQPKHNKLLDSIPIEKTTSLYLRIKFNATDSTKYKDFNFEADYNDAYIAYLNGEEIARKNIGKPGDAAPFDKLADKAHKTATYRNYYAPVNGVYIDSAIVKRLIRKGENIFAVHVMNDSVNGSDISFLANVYNLIDCYSQWYYGSGWVKYFRQLPLDSSKFPIVIINTDAYGIPLIADIPKQGIDKKVEAQISIIDNKGTFNKLSDPVDFTGRIALSRRGESSKDFPKMCFTVETQDSNGENLDTAIMGMPSDNDWILQSNYGDKTMLRNELTLNLGRKMDHYEPRTQYCELILNGEYQGLYCFMEKIKRGKKRVDVAKRDSLNPSEGGFVFKYDKPTAGRIQYVYPKESDITTTEKEYLAEFEKNMRAAINGNHFMHADSGYKKYLSGKSLIDNVIINEVTKNCDAYLFSTYFHKDKTSKDGRIKYGPLWDYDLAYSGAGWQNADRTYGWQFAEPGSNFLYVPQLFRDTALTHSLSNRWKILRTSILSDKAIFDDIDSIAAVIYDSRVKNYEVWPIINKPYLWPVYETLTYDDDITGMKAWLTERLKWIDDNIDKIYYPLTLDSPTLSFSSTQIEVYPNPFVERLKVGLIGYAGTYVVSIQDMTGKTITSKQVKGVETEYTEIEFTSNELNNVRNGVLFVMVTNNGRLVQAKKVVKANVY